MKSIAYAIVAAASFACVSFGNDDAWFFFGPGFAAWIAMLMRDEK